MGAPDTSNEAASLPAHTPGPWRACKDGACSCGQVWSIPGDFPVFTTADNRLMGLAHEHMADEFPDAVYQSIAPETVSANARLIAAAPDLLAVTRIWIEYLDSDGMEDARTEELLLSAMRAAIAKATEA